MTQTIQVADVPGLLRPGMTVLIPGCGGESLLFREALIANPEAARGVTFIGVLIPGVNRVDYAGLHDEARLRAFFLTPDIAKSYADGKVEFLPVHYSAVTKFLQNEVEIDLALIQVAPAAQGRHSVGIAADFIPAVLDNAKAIVAHVNPEMPAMADGPTIETARLDYIVEEAAALIEYDLGRLYEPLLDLGRNVASLIGDGDTIEIGLGKIQAAVLGPLTDRKDLRLHAGMICDPLTGLLASGAFAKRSKARPPVTTGVAVGSRGFYDFVSQSSDITFRPVTHTHDAGVLSEIENLVAINSSIEIDLLGQANAEMIGGRQVSSAGGLVDFMRGAHRSRGGRAVLALISATSDGKTSRIVPNFATGTAVSCARADIDFVVTEHGIADLRGTGVRARAEALIQIAAPAFRAELEAAAKALKG
ncbi:MAG TPA: acetyl-CoA hydrolase/transferase C-terminal domain-containing protein [Alphaproteobacteria bacterium]|nr:acetyl-CoA hydrolase/transferase C-terminal domain-containing protein [Alphaproteobacteria bacterium]